MVDNNYWDETPTPQDLFDELNEEFNFILDAAATDENTKCVRWYTKENSALENKWFANTWCNPPYSRPNIPLFVNKAIDELEKRNTNLVVMLLPADTSTAWFHLIYPKYEVRFIKGKVKFPNRENFWQSHMLVIMRGSN